MRGAALRISAITALYLGSSSLAQAVDWTGLSVGIGGGYGMVNHELDLSTPAPIFGISGNLNIDGIGGEGGFFTLSAGGDYQLNSKLVIGAFVDYDFMSLDSESSLSIPPLGGLAIGTNVEVEDQLSIGGRFGYLINPSTLVFLSAGYAHVDIGDMDFSFGIGGSSIRGTLLGIGDFDGYFLGGGIETELFNGFTLKAEYRYTNLEAEQVTLLPSLAPGINSIIRTELEPDIQTARLSLNYRFGLGRGGDTSVTEEPVASGASWTGPYIGVGAGYGAANNEVSFEEGPLLPPGLFDVNIDGFGHQGRLFTIGAGYDFQTHSRIVLGVFADFDLTSLDHNDSLRLDLFGSPITARLHGEFEDLAMVGGRVGYLVSPETMVFASAGYARAESEDVTLGISTPGGSGSITVFDGEDFSGFFVGGGIEARLFGNLSLKAEYRYIDLGSENVTLLPDVAPFLNDLVSTEFDPTIQTGRLSINYRFGGPRDDAAPMK